MIVNCIAIIDIGICIGENLLLGIGIGSVVIFLYRWNPSGDDDFSFPCSCTFFVVVIFSFVDFN